MPVIPRAPISNRRLGVLPQVIDRRQPDYSSLAQLGPAAGQLANSIGDLAQARLRVQVAAADREARYAADLYEQHMRDGIDGTTTVAPDGTVSHQPNGISARTWQDYKASGRTVGEDFRDLDAAWLETDAWKNLSPLARERATRIIDLKRRNFARAAASLHERNLHDEEKWHDEQAQIRETASLAQAAALFRQDKNEATWNSISRHTALGSVVRAARHLVANPEAAEIPNADFNSLQFAPNVPEREIARLRETYEKTLQDQNSWRDREIARLDAIDERNREKQLRALHADQDKALAAALANPEVTDRDLAQLYVGQAAALSNIDPATAARKAQVARRIEADLKREAEIANKREAAQREAAQRAQIKKIQEHTYAFVEPLLAQGKYLDLQGREIEISPVTMAELVDNLYTKGQISAAQWRTLQHYPHKHYSRTAIDFRNRVFTSIINPQFRSQVLWSGDTSNFVPSASAKPDTAVTDLSGKKFTRVLDYSGWDEKETINLSQAIDALNAVSERFEADANYTIEQALRDYQTIIAPYQRDTAVRSYSERAANFRRQTPTRIRPLPTAMPPGETEDITEDPYAEP